MLYVSRPDNSTIRGWLDQQSLEQLSYDEVGATDNVDLPAGFHHINYHQVLGRGETVFLAAIEALRQWSCFNLPWSRLIFDGKPQVGNHLAITVRIGGLWSTHCCRVVDHDPGLSDPGRWSMTIGTLPRHMARGEERISVSLDQLSGDVTYWIRSFSRPNWRLARWCLPWVHQQQDRFCRESFAAMRRFVKAQNRMPVTSVIRAS